MSPSGEQRPTHSQSEPSKTSGSSSVSNDNIQGNGSQKLNVEVNVKFNHEMFKNEVVKLAMDNAPKITEQGLNKGR